jgi:hypothetical protein
VSAAALPRIYLHARVLGIRLQDAAEQHEPDAQAPGPVQSMVQLLPLQGTLPAQAFVPMQEILLEAAPLDTPPLQDIVPEQVVVHMLP